MNNEGLYEAVEAAETLHWEEPDSGVIATELRLIREILMWRWLTPGVLNEIERRREERST